MSTIDVDVIARDMSAAALKVFKGKWTDVKSYAETEFRKLGETLAGIQRAKLAGEINKKEAELLLDMQKNAMRSVMLTIEGLGILAVEQAINAALKVISVAVNKAIGWTLL